MLCSTDWQVCKSDNAEAKSAQSGLRRLPEHYWMPYPIPITWPIRRRSTLAPCPLQPPHKVNLASPDKTILVNLLKNACGVAVVQQYKELAKFNVHMLTHPPEEEEEGGGGKQAAEGAAAAAGGADGGAAAAGGEGGGGQEGEQQEEQQEQQQQEEQPAQAGAGA